LRKPKKKASSARSRAASGRKRKKTETELQEDEDLTIDPSQDIKKEMKEGKEKATSVARKWRWEILDENEEKVGRQAYYSAVKITRPELGQKKTIGESGKTKFQIFSKGWYCLVAVRYGTSQPILSCVSEQNLASTAVSDVVTFVPTDIESMDEVQNSEMVLSFDTYVDSLKKKKQKRESNF
jgi:hypothetical protein